ncbi:membrane protein YqaA, SNARE-associated domain [Halopelagius inordinatus]|uniref:Membrane protein YqaA, SNARE-associated domain n=1 Tax=Halopelagius inordinatus TaxID=553467 RepID=A0A1I2MSH1_9EURY|nr:VTT domain-containing protein [Halopelagius inordinatus]SFF94363.1 membrane protein YqaA, SNARE-associated domain [Halopelagius inordinatus]
MSLSAAEVLVEGAVHAGHVADFAATGTSLWPDFGWLSDVVKSASGWFGLLVIFAYSFLIAFALPGVSEVVLLAPIDMGLTYWQRMTVIILVSGVGKAAGSVFAFHIGQEAKEAGPIVRALRRSRFDVVEWSEKTTLELARTWGYAGLALALCVPGFPDTLSIYAFSVLEEDYLKFAIATFVGSVGRLVITLVGFEAVIAIGWL